MKRSLLIVLVAFAFSYSLHAIDTREQLNQEYDALLARKSDLTDTERLEKVFDIDWRYCMLSFPEWATSVGYPGYDGKWTDMSEAAIEQRKIDIRRPVAVLESINRAKLGKTDQLNYDLFLRSLKLTIEFQKFPGELLAISQLGGVQQEAAQTIEQMPHRNAADYQSVLERLRGLPQVVDQNIELLRRGIATKVVRPKITLRDVPQQILNVIPAEPKESALLRLFQDFPENFPDADKTRLKTEAEKLYREQLVPAFRRLYDFVDQQYLPAGRETIAMSALPQGADWYALCVKSHTTTNLTPQQIHDIGQKEVVRIRKEMEALIQSVGFKGSFDEFLHYLHTDPKFIYTSGEELLKNYRDIAKRIDPQLGLLFGKLPRLPYGVRPVPAYAEKSQTTAYYESGSVRTGRPGYFYANTYNLPARPSWEMEALTLHEAVPGHHLQLSVAQELENLPEWRKYDSYTAYIEGWGLYAESLGGELGLYTDPYQKFGKLSFEMWRACRLVVDTGMHSLGWTRDQAIQFMIKNSGNPEHDTIVEVDRYIVWPGQALAYKIGQLKLRELRTRAETTLGSKFDIRAFHDLVLGQGALPLDVLEQTVNEWIDNQKAKP